MPIIVHGIKIISIRANTGQGCRYMWRRELKNIYSLNNEVLNISFEFIQK